MSSDHLSGYFLLISRFEQLESSVNPIESVLVALSLEDFVASAARCCQVPLPWLMCVEMANLVKRDLAGPWRHRLSGEGFQDGTVTDTVQTHAILPALHMHAARKRILRVNEDQWHLSPHVSAALVSFGTALTSRFSLLVTVIPSCFP